jgi:uncharacterized membrane protein
MISPYNRIAGQSVERLAALSDGIFAVAMTLLVLDIHAPAVEAVHSGHDVLGLLAALAPRFLMFGLSFMTLGIFWVGQQTQLNHLERSDRSLTWIHLAFLAIVCLLPFSTSFLAEFTRYRAAFLVYWLNIFLLGVALYFSWDCALNSGLVKSELPPTVTKAIKDRIILGQSLYAFGALLCVFNTYWSIGLIVVVQLYYVIAPRLPGRRE